VRILHYKSRTCLEVVLFSELGVMFYHITPGYHYISVSHPIAGEFPPRRRRVISGETLSSRFTPYFPSER
jgi:hypothetical protein